MRYLPGGTGVLDCFEPNRELTVSVDRSTGSLVVSSAVDPARPLALRRDAEVELRAELFTGAALSAEWLRVPADVEGGVVERMEAELGPAMTRYLFAPGLPANGAETATEALTAAGEVTQLTPGHGDRRAGLSGYRIHLDAKRWDDAVPAEDGPAASSAPPLIDVWLDASDEVVRVAVSPVSAGGGGGSAEDGWAVEYQEMTAPLDERFLADDVVDLSAVDVGRLRAAPPSCALDTTRG